MLFELEKVNNYKEFANSVKLHQLLKYNIQEYPFSLFKIF